MKPKPLAGRLALAVLLSFAGSAARAQPTEVTGEAPWGQGVDGIACRVSVQPSYVIGEPITLLVEVKNSSDRKRYLCPPAFGSARFDVMGPDGRKVPRFLYFELGDLSEQSFQAIRPVEFRRRIEAILDRVDAAWLNAAPQKK